MPLPSFHIVSHSDPIHHTSSNSSLRARDTGRFGVPFETELVFLFACVTFSFLTPFLFAAKLYPFFLVQSHLASINQRPIFKQVRTLIRIHTRTTMCPFLPSSFRLPNQRLPTETPILGTHIQVLTQDFTPSAG